MNYLVKLILLIALIVGIIWGCLLFVKWDDNRSSGSSNSGSWGIVSYNGHTYVKLSEGYGKAIAHNPDCECKEEK